MFIGKAIYVIGMLLLFNFFFGLLFLPFFFWLLAGVFLFVLLTAAAFLGKKIIVKPFSQGRQQAAQRPGGYKKNGDVIDVEAEVVNDGKEKRNGS